MARARDYKAEAAKRNVLAQQRGYKSYAEERAYRSLQKQLAAGKTPSLAEAYGHKERKVQEIGKPVTRGVFREALTGSHLTITAYNPRQKSYVTHTFLLTDRNIQELLTAHGVPLPRALPLMEWTDTSKDAPNVDVLASCYLLMGKWFNDIPQDAATSAGSDYLEEDFRVVKYHVWNRRLSKSARKTGLKLRRIYKHE